MASASAISPSRRPHSWNPISPISATIPTRYFHEASSVDFATSLRYAFKTLWVLTRFRLDRRWALLRRPAAWIAPERG